MINLLIRIVPLCLVLAACGSEQPAAQQAAAKEILYVGTYSVRNSKGLYVYTFDREQRKFELLETHQGPDSPSYLDISPDEKYLYTTNRQGIGTDTLSGSVSAYRIDPTTGKLQLLNEASSSGISPCHIYADSDNVYVSHYAGGSLSVLSLRSDGGIDALLDTVQHTGSGPNTSRQEAAHLHSILGVPNTPYFLAADLGTDEMTFYQIENGQVVKAPIPAIESEPGSGPRHFTFSPDGRKLYVAEEITSTVSVYDLDTEQRQTTFLQRLPTLPADFQDATKVADIHLSPDGKFLYISNRGHESLAIYRVKSDGTLGDPQFQSVLGKTPRNFLIDPQGTFILVGNKDTDEIILFDRDQETGLLEPTEVRIKMPSPVCIRMLII